jgi:beta-N-acetylhexosaminidase
MNRVGMQATGKHFPGHGFVAADSHVDIPRDDRSVNVLEDDDLIPFRRLAARLGGIMPAHVIYPQVAPEPAGFSRYWLQDVLRGALGFAGVIFSDDLSMEGATVAGGFPQRAAAALDAGCDMVLVCNHRAGALEVLDYLAGRTGDSQAGQRIAALGARQAAPSADELAWLRTQVAEVA